MEWLDSLDPCNYAITMVIGQLILSAPEGFGLHENLGVSQILTKDWTPFF